MRPRGPNIETLKKPLQLLLSDGARRTIDPLQPGKLLLLETFVPQAKAILTPVKDLHLVPMPIRENKQGTRKNIHPKLHFHNRSQPIDRLSEVNTIPIEEDLIGFTRLRQFAPKKALFEPSWLEKSVA